MVFGIGPDGRGRLTHLPWRAWPESRDEKRCDCLFGDGDRAEFFWILIGKSRGGNVKVRCPDSLEYESCILRSICLHDTLVGRNMLVLVDYRAPYYRTHRTHRIAHVLSSVPSAFRLPHISTCPPVLLLPLDRCFLFFFFLFPSSSDPGRSLPDIASTRAFRSGRRVPAVLAGPSLPKNTAPHPL